MQPKAIWRAGSKATCLGSFFGMNADRGHCSHGCLVCLPARPGVRGSFQSDWQGKSVLDGGSTLLVATFKIGKLKCSTILGHWMFAPIGILFGRKRRMLDQSA